MNKIILLFLLLFSLNITAQVGIGTTSPDPSATLEINSTTSGLLIPRMTEVQRENIASPAIGLMVFQTDNSSGFYYYDGGAWITVGTSGTGSGGNWTTSGDDIYNTNVGNVGIGTTTPSTKLHLEDASGSTTGSFNDGFEDGTLDPFSSGGNATWFVQSTIVNSGSNAVESGNINDSETSYLEYNVTIPTGGATLSFYYEVSSESGWDFLRFYISGVQQNEWSGTIAYTQQSYALAAGSHILRWAYEKDSSLSNGNDAAYIDDIDIDNVVIASPVLRIVDGTQANGYVLTSDANGNTSWSDPSSGGNSDDDGDWTISGANMSNANTGQVSVINSLAGGSAFYGENSSASLTAGTHGIQGVTNSVDLIGSAGVYGESVTSGIHEIGVMGDYALWGNAVVGIGWATSVSDIPTSGGSSGETNDIGVFGSVNYSTGIGVYGLNYNATGYAGYFDGTHVITGSKSASVPTTKGNQLVYSTESPEIWFEDFGQGKLTNGNVHIDLEEMFQETVFIDEEHPMHVFLQEQGDCNGLFFTPDANGKGFIVTEKENGNSNITFSYRISAKRRFYQDHRFGVDQLKPLEDNLVNAKYVEPRTSSLEEMKIIIINAASEKNSQKGNQPKKASKKPEESKKNK